MAAYMIVFARVHDRARFIAEYARPTAELLVAHGGEYLVRAPTSLALEGGQMLDGMSSVISKWPDRRTLMAFWESEAYSALKAARAGIADAHVMVVED